MNDDMDVVHVERERSCCSPVCGSAIGGQTQKQRSHHSQCCIRFNDVMLCGGERLMTRDKESTSFQPRGTENQGHK